jgi:hypothetical protein
MAFTSVSRDTAQGKQTAGPRPRRDGNALIPGNAQYLQRVLGNQAFGTLVQRVGGGKKEEAKTPEQADAEKFKKEFNRILDQAVKEAREEAQRFKFRMIDERNWSTEQKAREKQNYVKGNAEVWSTWDSHTDQRFEVDKALKAILAADSQKTEAEKQELLDYFQQQYGIGTPNTIG